MGEQPRLRLPVIDSSRKCVRPTTSGIVDTNANSYYLLLPKNERVFFLARHFVTWPTKVFSFYLKLLFCCSYYVKRIFKLDLNNE